MSQYSRCETDQEVMELRTATLENGEKPVVTKKKVVNLKAQRYGQVFVTEFVATALLVFMVCMGCTSGISGDALSPVQSPLASGFAVATLVQTFGHISDCHMNPAVTMCFLSRGLIDIPMSIVYIIAELLGAASGYGMLVALLPKGILAVNPEHCMTLVHSEMSNTNGALFEFIITSVLMFLICGLLDARNSSKQDSAPIKFGLCIICLSFVGVSYKNNVFSLIIFILSIFYVHSYSKLGKAVFILHPYNINTFSFF